MHDEPETRERATGITYADMHIKDYPHMSVRESMGSHKGGRRE